MPRDNIIQLGTIVSSILDFDNFARINGDSIPQKYSVTHSKWAPADGRTIVGSDLSSKTTLTQTPDLRGSFLRGLNQFDSLEQSAVLDNRKDPQIRIVGSFQSDEFKKHSHWTKRSPVGNGGNSALMAGDSNVFNYPTQDQGNGDETRPKNVAVYFYIKIN